MSDFVQTLLDRNEAYRPHHEARPPLPTMNAIVICCLDARIDPTHFLGVAPGEALVLRNAGGRVTEAVEHELGLILAMVSKFLDQPVIPEIVIVHHTDCGVENFSNDELAAGLSQATGVGREIVDCLAISDHESSLRTDLERLRSSSHLPTGLPVTGLLYDAASGHASVVFSDSPTGDASN